MSEKKIEGVEEELTLPGIKCNEGPAQIVPVAAIPVPVKVVRPGTLPPMQFELRTMRPVMIFEKPACSRHKFYEAVDIGTQKICGNCAHGVPVDLPKEEAVEETENNPKLIKG